MHAPGRYRRKTGTGRLGTYEWAVKDGLWYAYHYPGELQTRTPVVLMPRKVASTSRTARAWQHNKAGF